MLNPGCGVGRDRVSQVLPFSMEVRDSLFLLLVMGFCVGPVFAVIVGVCRQAGVLWFPCGIVPMCGRVLSNYRCMRGCPVSCTVVCMGRPVFTMDVGPLTRWSPPCFWGAELCSSASCMRRHCMYMLVMSRLICVYSEAPP